MRSLETVQKLDKQPGIKGPSSDLKAAAPGGYRVWSEGFRAYIRFEGVGC